MICKHLIFAFILLGTVGTPQVTWSQEAPKEMPQKEETIDPASFATEAEVTFERLVQRLEQHRQGLAHTLTILNNEDMSPKVRVEAALINLSLSHVTFKELYGLALNLSKNMSAEPEIITLAQRVRDFLKSDFCTEVLACQEQVIGRMKEVKSQNP